MSSLRQAIAQATGRRNKLEVQRIGNSELFHVLVNDQLITKKNGKEYAIEFPLNEAAAIANSHRNW